MHVFSAVQRNEEPIDYLDDRISLLVGSTKKKEKDKTDLGSDKEAAKNDLSLLQHLKRLRM